MHSLSPLHLCLHGTHSNCMENLHRSNLCPLTQPHSFALLLFSFFNTVNVDIGIFMYEYA